MSLRVIADFVQLYRDASHMEWFPKEIVLRRHRQPPFPSKKQKAQTFTAAPLIITYLF